jgi:hypothetical protein
MKTRPSPVSQAVDPVPASGPLPPGGLAGGAWGILGIALVGGTLLAADEPVARRRAHLQSVSEIATAPASALGLGVTLSRATPVLRRQLGLERGAGLVAEDVKAGSMAASRGFLQHDVLVRLDDQILVLPEQFDALLESAEPEDPLACTVLRGGREEVISLGRKHQDPPRSAATNEKPRAPAEPRRGGLRPTASALAIVSPVSRQPTQPGGFRRLADETLVRNDPDFSIRVSRGEDTWLTVSEPGGRVVFQGNIDSAEDRGRVPAAVQDRVVDMEKLLEPRGSADGNRVVPASAVAAPGAASQIGQLNVAPVELR